MRVFKLWHNITKLNFKLLILSAPEFLGWGTLMFNNLSFLKLCTKKNSDLILRKYANDQKPIDLARKT